MTSVEAYLAIPEDYGRRLGGLRWSADGEAVEFAASDPEVGLTFAMRGEIAQFLEGLAADGTFPHFAFVIHLLHALGFGQRVVSPAVREPASPAEFEALAREFRETGRSLRNAGALFAALLADVPRVPDPPRPAVLMFELRRLAESRSFHRFARVVLRGEEPPLEARAFERRVRRAVGGLGREAIRHWLRHGRGPLPGAGVSVARELPRTLGAVLSAAEERPRLRAAAALVARLDGALALPPRRLARAELPLGGYVDVATRGQVEQILPGQLALEPDEFLRRFAARELLYFHREEPRAPAARELVLVVDQGVRTWGDPRLVLAAAALALGRQAERRGLALRVATTGNGGEAVATLDAGPDAVADLLEASDLTPGPADALRKVLAGLDDAPRDVVLLTHPRSLDGPDVAAAAARPPAETRLFAVAVDSEGAVTLAALRRGAPVALGRCRVDLAGPGAPAPAPAPGTAAGHGWRGDVEAIGFPFRLGVQRPIRDTLVAFDHAGDWLLLADRAGLLHAWRADGSGSEVLPRATLGRDALVEPTAVVGVAGGFVVVGTAGGKEVAAHLALHARAATTHALAAGMSARQPWAYSERYHAVVNLSADGPLGAIDLAAPRSAAVVTPVRQRGSPRAAEALRAALREPSGVRLTADLRQLHPGRSVALDAATGRLGVRDENGFCLNVTPLADNAPALKGARVVRARWQGEHLALLIEHADRRRVLHVYATRHHLITIDPLEQHVMPHDLEDFALSADGRRVAWRSGTRQLLAREVGTRTPPPLATTRGRFHPDLRASLTRHALAVQAGRHAHLIRWERGRLEFERCEGSVDRYAPVGADRPAPWRGPGTPRARPEAIADAVRFFAFEAAGGLTAAVDRFGQVAMLDHLEGLVCMFYVFRGEAAVWAPDGSRLGPVSLSGGPPTPGAADRIGAALLRASERAGGAGGAP